MLNTHLIGAYKVEQSKDTISCAMLWHQAGCTSSMLCNGKQVKTEQYAVKCQVYRMKQLKLRKNFSQVDMTKSKHRNRYNRV